ncbi:MAG: hypothetical protein V7640_2579 [Betaproteobacteria bacterium]
MCAEGALRHYNTPLPRSHKRLGAEYATQAFACSSLRTALC